MVKTFLKLSVLLVLIFLVSPAKADSFLLSEPNNIEQDHIIPLVYVDNMEYYNHTKTSAYTKKIIEQLSLEPKLIVTEDKNMADYLLKPKLIQSKIEPLNRENSRYSMSVAIELWKKNGALVETEQQSRYIIIENNQNPQKIAKKLLTKLLEATINNFILKIKNNQLHIG